MNRKVIFTFRVNEQLLEQLLHDYAYNSLEEYFTAILRFQSYKVFILLNI